MSANWWQFLESILNHKARFSDHLKTIEEFTKYAFPTSPKETFSSMVYGKLPRLGLKSGSNDFAVEFCDLMISLWSRCMVEKYVSIDGNRNRIIQAKYL